MQITDIESKVERYIINEKLFNREDHLLLAVSGGIDSMVMLHILRTLNYSLQVAHINYHLRGQEANEDAELVMSYCQKHQIPYHIYEITETQVLDLRSGNLQDKAREIRYHFFNQLLSQESLDKICTAHHQNDQVETFLFRAIRQSGLIGLSSIHPSHEHLCRPLLCLTKQEITAYARDNRLKWREDHTNETNEYDRNYLRNEVIVPLIKRWPKAISGISQSVQWIQDESKILQWAIENIEREYCHYDDHLSLINPLSGLLALPGSNSILFHIIRKYGFNQAQAIDISNNRSQSGNIYFSSTHRLLIDRDRLLIQPLNSMNQQAIILDESDIAQPIEVHNYLLTIDKADVPITLSEDPLIEYIDADRLEWPLQVRLTTNGDKIRPLGMKGKSKLVSDILIDAKMNLFDKECQWVLRDQNEIVWLIGMRMAEPFKVTPKTKNVLQLAWCIKDH